MQENLKDGSACEQEALPYKKRMWKNFQEKTKPFLSPKFGSDRRSAEVKKEPGGKWIFNKKRHVLDRVFSSSQPNICCSAPQPLDCERSVCNQGDPGNKEQPEKQVAVAPANTDPNCTAKQQKGSPEPAVSHLILSHQKSSSLGSDCFERLLDPAESEVKDCLRKNASDSVSKRV
ncbi:MCTP1 protein, partial [Polyodon spathula]|nr:MCTP1 protein [Polyodon spathula]